MSLALVARYMFAVVFSLQHFTFTAKDGRIAITLDEQEADRLQTLVKGHVGKPLTLEVDGKTIASPVIRDVPAGRTFELSFDDPKDFAEVKAALAAHGK